MSNSLSDALRRKLIYITSFVLVLSVAGKGWPYASNPNPADGAIFLDTWASLNWLPGTHAVSNDIYFGENFDDVKLGTGGTFMGNQTGTLFVVGFPGFPYPDGLVPGTTYYWRIDDVNVIHPDSPWKGDVWRLMIPPRTAYNPDPPDGVEVEDVDVQLGWAVGLGSVLHTLYFGESFDEVDNATGGLVLGVRKYTPGHLEYEKTYYWRVDEFDGDISYKGDVWSFTVRAFSEPVVPDDVTGRTIYVDGTRGDNSNDGLTLRTALKTIQRGIDSAANGDTVIVAPARYTGGGNRDLDFRGKAITVCSVDPNDKEVVAATIIDCEGRKEEPHRGFYFHSGETSSSVLDGFTIKNGYKHPGGGIYCSDSGPIIKNCIITKNTAEQSNGIGGGCFFSDSFAEIINCQITFNSAIGTSRHSGNGWGGGIACESSTIKIKNTEIKNNSGTSSSGGIGAGWSSSLYIDNCVISGNSSEAGGGLKFQDSDINITNSTITENSAEFSGGGFYYIRSNIVVANSILWGDTGGEIDGWDSTITVTYCDVQGGWAGEGNINADPLFVNTVNADYHLQAGSPCIDAGDNSAIPESAVVDLDGNPRIINGIVDMGAYEFGVAPPPPTLSEALDTELSFTTSGNADWFGQTAMSYYGGDAAQSGDISHNQESWMQTTVDGAGTVKFYWKVSSEEDFDFLEFYIDGSLQEKISGSINWQQKMYTINTLGPHTLGWRYVKDKGMDSGGDCGWIDKLEWVPTPPPPPTLSEALDTELVFTMSGNADWFGQTTTSYYGEDATQSGDVSHNQESWMQTTVDGAGTVTFYWKVSSEEDFDFLEFYIDGSLQEKISGSVNWQQMTCTINAMGPHTLEWRYVKDKGTDSGSDCGWVDKLEWVPAPPPILSEALDSDLSFVTGGKADWFFQTTTFQYGGDAAQSGDISQERESWLQTTVSGAGTVSFFWKVSSEMYFDFLEFYIDGWLQDRISGSVDWKQMTYTITDSGVHTLEWRYMKDVGTDSGSDCGWVDKVEWTPAP